MLDGLYQPSGGVQRAFAREDDHGLLRAAARGALRGPGGSSGGSGGVGDIINNPNMSLEEKLQAILTLITRDTDDEILDVMKDMASVRDERAGLGTDQNSRAREAKLETTMEQLNLRLQKLMEKRKQMFDLMSNISSNFNEMAKQAIQNLGRA